MKEKKKPQVKVVRSPTVEVKSRGSIMNDESVLDDHKVFEHIIDGT